MSGNFIHDLGHAQVLRGMGDHLAQNLLTHWLRERSTQTMELAKAGSNTVWFSTRTSLASAPRILLLGQESLAARVIGATPSLDVDTVNGSISDDYKKFAGLAYHDAVENWTPKFDLVSSQYETAEGQVRLVYQRLILPYRTPAHRGSHLLLYSRLLDWKRLGHSKDPRDQLDDSPPTTAMRDCCPARPAASPNECRMG